MVNSAAPDPLLRSYQRQEQHPLKSTGDGAAGVTGAAGAAGAADAADESLPWWGIALIVFIILVALGFGAFVLYIRYKMFMTNPAAYTTMVVADDVSNILMD